MIRFDMIRFACAAVMVAGMFGLSSPAAAQSSVWYRQFGTLPYQFDSINDMAVDGDGNVLTAGVTEGSLFDTTINDGQSDPFVAKFNAAGNLLWSDQFGTSVGEVFSMDVDAAGNSFVVGSGLGLLSAGFPEETGSFLVKYDASGNVQWRKMFEGSVVDSVAVDAAGDLIVAGGFSVQGAGSYGDFLAKYDTNGVQLWREELAQYGVYNVQDMSLTGNGDIAVVTPSLSEFNPVGPLPPYLATFSGDGTFIASDEVEAPGALEPSASGGVFLLRASGPDDTRVVAYDAPGTVLWSETISDANPAGMASDDDGALYIATHVARGVATGNDIRVFKYTADGQFLWARTLGGEYRDSARTIAAGAGYVYVGGWTEGDYSGENTRPGQQADALLIQVPEPALGGLFTVLPWWATRRRSSGR